MIGTALIAVDVQYDFLPGGALGVPHGEEVTPALQEAAKHGSLVVASADWHPSKHMSFKEQGGPWPMHCVAGTHGAEIHPSIKAIADLVVPKGTRMEAYSAFDCTGLALTLRAKGITSVVVGGLATDYCVKATVLDALKAGFDTTVLTAACRGVDVNPGDSDEALKEMQAAGAKIV